MACRESHRPGMSPEVSPRAADGARKLAHPPHTLREKGQASACVQSPRSDPPPRPILSSPSGAPTLAIC